VAKETRSILRKIDKSMVKGEINKAFTQTLESVSEFDREKMHSEAIEILVKVLEYEEVQNDRVKHQEILAHLMMRYVLNGEINKAKNIKFIEDLKLPICELAQTVLESHDSDTGSPYILQSVEKKSIFGDYMVVPSIPALYIEEEDDAIRILEDYFPNGKYVVNILERESTLQHSKKVDIGNSEETNIVENRRVFKLE
jgi:hypothetical protein